MKRATLIIPHIVDKSSDFNPRPREEGDIMLSNNEAKAVNFNPRPREEGDAGNVLGIHDFKRISIHALVKRATRLSVRPLQFSQISIHALVKRATGLGLALSKNNLISIHALVKRATRNTAPLADIALFQSTPS